MFSDPFSRPLFATGTDTATFSYFHTDALGSPIVKTNSAGISIETSEYEPYGRLLNRENDDRAGYTGHVMDSASGLTYMQQRYYDPNIGRFLSVDPVTAISTGGASFNRYWYANNNPYRLSDPDGRIAYQNGRDIYIPIFYKGKGATREFISRQIQRASQLVTEDGTRFFIIPLSHETKGGNVMDVSPGYDRRAVHGEGILAGSNNSAAHINSSRPDATGATLHDSLHFVPGLGDGRKSDGYIETGGYGDSRSGEAGLKDGFSHDQIMADTVNGFMLRSWETDFVDDAINGNGTIDELKKVLNDGN